MKKSDISRKLKDVTIKQFVDKYFDGNQTAAARAVEYAPNEINKWYHGAVISRNTKRVFQSYGWNIIEEKKIL